MTEPHKSTLMSPQLAQPSGVFGHGTAVSAGGRFAFVSGMTSRAPDGSVYGVGDIEAQTQRVIESISSVLSEADMSLADVVRLTVYIRDMADFDAIHRVRAEYFVEELPASTMVEVSRLVEEEFLIEIDAVAWAPEPR